MDCSSLTTIAPIRVVALLLNELILVLFLPRRYLEMQKMVIYFSAQQIPSSKKYILLKPQWPIANKVQLFG